ncbi:MAG: TRAP transporter small permease [Vannielia sp.]|uniref:TRAP transporter small permease n=1 Tax=Rhodobacterales TaxID=204455 RepID=UPI002095DB1F|nr:TRAP transporter small permease [Oceanicola sp. 502str15]MCO6381116.1 TRAP transporter small permease subunit [Oceanicola sp. 502str15]
MRRRARYSPEGVFSTLIFCGLIVVILIQILGRTPLFTGPVWTEELARWLWVWMVFIGIGEAERTNAQLRMDLLGGLLKERGRMILFTAIDLVYFGVACHLVWIGWKTVERTWRNASVTLPAPDGAMYLAAFLGMILVVWRIGARLLGKAGRDGDGVVL